MNIMSRRRQVNATKTLAVHIRWGEQKLAALVPKVEKKEEGAEAEKEDEKVEVPGLPPLLITPHVNGY